jgi:hypothetical protein
MKLLVVHDELGNIKSAAVVAGEPGPRAGLHPHRGDFVIEVEAPPGVELRELRRNPRSLSENFRVDTVNHRLVHKGF